MRPLLLPLTPLYGAGVAVRNWFFDIGILRTHRIGVPVISVGNITAGGTGKTPFVEFLAKRLLQKGRKVAIISRGYKRQSSDTLVVSNGSVRCAEASDAGDEPAQMASKLGGAVVVVDEERVRGAAYAVEKFGADAVILDDGFQHRSLYRDADVVIIPQLDISDPGWMLPAGNRRESLSSLKRATLLAISRCDTLAQFERARDLLLRGVDKPVVGLTTKIAAFRRAGSRFSVDLACVKGKSAVAFSGIGNPSSFDRTLASLGVDVKKYTVFPDHHFYTESELKNLERSRLEGGSDYLITTEKDVARLTEEKRERRIFLERVPLFYVEIEQSVLTGESMLNEMLDRF